jgi:hypothetical protein
VPEVSDSEVRTIALDAAEAIIVAVEELPPRVMLAVTFNLWNDRSTSLSSVGRCLLEGGDRVAELASALIFESWTGDVATVVETLGDGQPWGTIRDAMRNVLAAWRASRPDHRWSRQRGPSS